MSEDSRVSRRERVGLVTGRPWWRWNLVTLAVALFVLIWVRELTNLPLSMTWTTIGTIFGVWYLGPTFVTGRVPWPVSVVAQLTPPSMPVAKHGPTPRVIVLLRVAAVLLAIGSVVQSGYYAYMVLQSWGYSGGPWRGMPRGLDLVYFFAGVIWASAQSLALAIGLWALADIGLWVRRASDASDDSEP